MERNKIYLFWVDRFKYEGEIIDETDSHFIIRDKEDGIIWIPKGCCVIKEIR